MGAKVTFDSANRLITVTAAPVGELLTLDVQTDLYSDMKEDTGASSALASNPPALLPSEGGAPTETGVTGQYYFINNGKGWRLQPYDADHELILVGNLLAADATVPWKIPRPGRTIAISREFSNLAGSVATGASALSAAESAALFEAADYNTGRWDIVGVQMIFYKSDNVTEIGRFNLFDSGGSPTSDPSLVFQRTRV